VGEAETLVEAFRKTQHQIGGHGPRSVGVLKEALSKAPDDMTADTYGQGIIIERFQRKIADYLGKEAAVFFPSGTMAQQIALRIWCERANNPQVAYHPLCHLEIHEQDGLKKLHHINPILLATPDRLITIDDVTNLGEPVACLLLELPQREIGGELPSFAELADISAYCREMNIRLHLDGARLYETLSYYGRSAADIAVLFDSVYVSFYKGIGGVAGAMLAGGQDFIDEAVVWKRRHGGDLISLYPYILAAEYYFDRRVAKMEQYCQEARELAARFNAVDGVSTRPLVPVTNMFHVHMEAGVAEAEKALIAAYQKTGVGLAGYLHERGPRESSFEVSIGDQYETIAPELIQETLDVLAAALQREPGAGCRRK
jgi:threonine aldolase